MIDLMVGPIEVVVGYTEVEVDFFGFEMSYNITDTQIHRHTVTNNGHLVGR